MSEFLERIAQLSPKKLALLAADLRSRLDRVEQARTEPIAIVGVGCRLPGGADDPESFWRLLRDGVDAITEIPSDRWDVDACWSEDPDEPGKMYTRQGGFVDGLDRFDAHFFGIAPREAMVLDPQQRLLLEVSWEALEHAGQPIDALQGSQTGVFVGISSSNYLQRQMAGGLERLDTYVGTGNAVSVAAGRLSYNLGLQGPSVSIDTACSSSLVAVHLACQSLLSGECRMALAGGVNVILGPEWNVVLSKARMLAPDGRCKTFDASADGFGRGEGCGIVVLKRLADAQADGDRIMAVIRGTAVNQDGRSSGLTAPNGIAQEALIRQALARARVTPAQVTYVEAHGTGTSLGDPIEVQAIASAYGEGRPANRPVLVGSVKTNVSHLEAAAGVTGLIKVALSLEHGVIPPHLHFKTPNPHIPWADLPVAVPTVATPWPAGNGPRIAGVSSFGFSGTNAHVVVEEAPAAPTARPQIDRPLHLLTLSAKTEGALDALASQFAETLKDTGEALADVCFTANTGRAHFGHRLAVVGSTSAEVRERLLSSATGEPGAGVARGTVTTSAAPTVAFLFTGQGSQYVEMGRALFETQPSFRRTLERCDEMLRPHLERPLLSVLYPASGEPSPIDDTGYTQPVLFAFEYALAELWRSWGVTPTMVLGHSVGEYVAACVAGVLSLEDALTLVAGRARLMQALPRDGAMAAIWADVPRVQAALSGLRGRVSLAAINGPASVVIAGPRGDVEAVRVTLEREGVRTQPLNVSHAFHSPLMEPMLDEFERLAAGLRFGQPRIGLVSNVTGRLAKGDEVATPAYWRRHVREAVQFRAGMETLRAEGCTVFLEVGPSPTLLGLGKVCLPDSTGAWLPSLRRGQDPWQTLLATLGALYAQGVGVRWQAFDADYPRRKIALPTYPFQRQRYWIEPTDLRASAETAPASNEPVVHPLLGRRVRSPLKDIVFERPMSVAALPFLADHQVYGTPVFPATASLVAAIAAAAHAFGAAGRYVVDQLSIVAPLPLWNDRECVTQVVLSPGVASAASFRLFSRDAKHDGVDDRWQLHAAGTVERHEPDGPATVRDSLEAVQARCTQTLNVDDYYDAIRARGMEYGPAFRGVAELWRGEGEALARLRLPRAAGETDGLTLHPALLDAAFQIAGAAFPPGAVDEDPETVYLALSVDRFRLYGDFPAEAWSHVRVRPPVERRPETVVGDFLLFDAGGGLIAEVEGLRLKRATREALRAAASAPAGELFYDIAWRPVPRGAAAGAAPAGAWLLIGTGGDLAETLNERFVREGVRTIRATDGATARLADLLRDASADAEQPLRGVLYFSALDAACRDELSAESLSRAQQAACGGLLSLVQALEHVGAPTRPRLWVFTRGAQPILSDRVAIEQAPVWGFARSLALEQPDLHCVTLDLDPSGGEGEADAIWHELSTPDSEDQIGYRRGVRYTARLQRAMLRDSKPDTGSPEPQQLTVTTRGILDNLELTPVSRRAPGPGEVAIEVSAAGLNFRDVLNALGMYPGDPGPLGNECVGRIVALGDDVNGLEIGQQVMGIGGGTFSSFVTTLADYVVPTPAGLSPEESATIPVTFLTADYALNVLGRMRAGDRVLIHAAAGGVGLAAVQLARRAGAEIFATAGSAEKRAYLESLGIRHVMSSRTLEFADEILARTDGEGVDLVLNSLAGEFIDASVRVLGTGGRFLEIGKTGIRTPEQMAQERPDVNYFAIYLGEVDPPQVQGLLRNLVTAFEQRALRPLPLEVFPIADASAAFRHMAQAKHIGKIVLLPPAPRREARTTVRSDRTYLVTGGLGALGLHTVRGLVDRGARYLVLAGRSAPSAAAADAIARLEDSGARIVLARGDVSLRDDVAAILTHITDNMPPLAGIVHAAGVLDDGVIIEQAWPRFETVLAPKVAGAWHLHELTRSAPLDFFVLFSSIASVLGSAGQANYAAANAFLDALAHRRVADGLPAVSLNWGRWAEGGMAAALNTAEQKRLDRFGLGVMTTEQAVGAFERALAHPGPQLAVLPVDWRKVADALGDQPPPQFLSEVIRGGGPARPASGAAAPPAVLEHLERTPPSKRRSVLQGYVRDHVGQVLGLDPGAGLDPQQGLRELGLDSLMAVELRNRLQRAIGRSLPSTLAFDCPNVAALSTYLADEILGLGATREAARERAPQEPSLVVTEDEPIAIVGLGCRFPGDANTPDQYWRLLSEGVDAISEVPRDRWDIDEFYDPDPDRPGKMYTRCGGFIRDVDRFDASFFGISPREAVSLDPQQRLLLEVSWQALEHAGQSPERLQGTRGGVFIGISTNDYGQLLAKTGDPAKRDAYVGTGNSLSVAAGRLSYVLGLQGPSLSVDTACSSSLVAVHLACQSLRRGECRVALAGGVNVILAPDITINFCRARMLAVDGRCKTFDAAADGYVRGEGAGIVVLKRLSAAHADGDRILAVIRGSAVNQDGRTSGLTVPNGPAQQALLRDALASARVASHEVDYVEAHGTGTALGDPIEMQALREALGGGRTSDHPLVVGSVKTNFGHLEAAAGIAGLIKVVLSLQRQEIPPHLHFNQLNPHIETGGVPIVIPTALTPWTANGRRRIAGVSSFGFSGTNAHVLLEEPPAEEPRAADERRPFHLLTLSGKSDDALTASARSLLDALAKGPAAPLPDVAFTANTGRSHFTHRLAIVARTNDELRDELAAFASGQRGQAITACVEGMDRPDIAFLFTGQGSQYVGMGRQLYETQPTFRRELERCDALLRPCLERPLVSVLYPESGDSPLGETEYTQPALFAFEYALAQLWRSWGVEPAAVVGHSLGEYVAACVAGVFSVDDGLKLAAARGRLMQRLPARGGMAAIFAGIGPVLAALERRGGAVSVAAVNGPDNIVISGDADAVRAIVAEFEAAGVRTRQLAVSHGFHSPLIEPMLDEFEQIARQIEYAQPAIPLISNLTGRALNGGQPCDAAYWRRHARQPVKFSEGIAAAHAGGCRIFLEVGPSPTLLGMARRCVPDGGVSWLPSLRPGRADWQQMLEALGALYVSGVPVDFAAFDRDYSRRKVTLPAYPFQRERYWLDAGSPTTTVASPATEFEDAVRAGERQSLEGPLDLALHTYADKSEFLERITTAYIVKALRELGAFASPSDRHTPQTIVERFGVLPAHYKLMTRWLERLAAEGLLVRDGDSFLAPGALPEPQLDALWAESRPLADMPYLVDYLTRSGDALTRVLRGNESALAVLFPGGSLECAEALYERAAPSRYMNAITREVAGAFVRARGTGRTLNVLELGGGTGGTTSAVLPGLPRTGVTYWFTDLSDFFLGRAAEKFKAYDVRYGVLNIENPPESQGYPLGAFDVVLAANVLHATVDLRTTLQHARSLLAPGGILLLLEDTEYQSFFDFSVALIDGWQRFSDDLRGNHPLVSTDGWYRALGDAGFEEVAMFPPAGSPAEAIGQTVILARPPVTSAVAQPVPDGAWADQVDGRRSLAPGGAPAGAPADDLRLRVAETLPSEREDVLVAYVRSQVASVLRLPDSVELHRRQRLMDRGVDSLMAVELRNRLANGIGSSTPLPATLIFDYPTIEGIARYLGTLLGVDAPPVEGAGAVSDRQRDLAAAANRIAELSDEETEALLIQRLENL